MLASGFSKNVLAMILVFQETRTNTKDTSNSLEVFTTTSSISAHFTGEALFLMSSQH